MKSLDFIIIGAQKAGTTSLHKYLSAHPSIYMPPEKEAVFFTDNLRLDKGYSWYLTEFFGDAEAGAIIGKATPHYSGYENAARNISVISPSSKIIYLIRDPIDRAYSQFLMNKKRGIERRSFCEAVDALLNEQPRVYNESNSYLRWGEYCRVLEDYYQYFDKDQILVIKSSDLKQNTRLAVTTILGFIGLNYHDSTIYDNQFHMAGVRKFKIIDRMRSIRALKVIWRTSIPFRHRRRLGFWLDQWNTKSDVQDSSAKQVLTPELYKKLKLHFRREYELLDATWSP